VSTPLRAILARWSVAARDELLERGAAAAPMEALPLADAQSWCVAAGSFTAESRIWVPAGAPPPDLAGRLRITAIGAPQDCEIVLRKPAPNVAIVSGGRRSRVFIGSFGYAFHAQLNLWRDATVLVGDSATSNGVRIVADEGVVRIGRDCMISDDVVLQGNDQHGIVDVASGALLNEGAAGITIGEHVWLGRRCMVMPNVRIGAGSIVAAGAVVAGDVTRDSVAAGVPARIVRSGTSWSRSPDRIDPRSREYLARARDAV
jgi:acetyltransferase-like isoleucine patch superfamily enzyme